MHCLLSKFPVALFLPCASVCIVNVSGKSIIDAHKSDVVPAARVVSGNLTVTVCQQPQRRLCLYLYSVRVRGSHS